MVVCYQFAIHTRDMAISRPAYARSLPSNADWFVALANEILIGPSKDGFKEGARKMETFAIPTCTEKGSLGSPRLKDGKM